MMTKETSDGNANFPGKEKKLTKVLALNNCYKKSVTFSLMSTIFIVSNKSVITVMTLSFRTDRSGKTVQTLINCS